MKDLALWAAVLLGYALLVASVAALCAGDLALASRLNGYNLCLLAPFAGREAGLLVRSLFRRLNGDAP